MYRKSALFILPAIFVFAFGVVTRSVQNVVPEIACATTDFSGIVTNDLIAKYKNSDIQIPPNVVAQAKVEKDVLGVAKPSERWIEVDLSEQKLYAWDGSELFLETAVSTGLPHTPTPKGEFRVWIKLRATKMEGGEGSYYYYLPNVPYVMFFENDEIPGWRGFGIHGTYWHNDFGTPRSHGCINTPTPVAEKLYHWATPVLPDGKSTVYSDEENPGIRVIIHD